MTLADKAACQQLISPLPLTTLEDWLAEWFSATGSRPGRAT